MKHDMEFIKLETDKIYFDKRSIVVPLIKKFLDKYEIKKFRIPTLRRNASVSVTFLPSIDTLRNNVDVLYSAIVCASLSSDDQSKNFRISFIENRLYANIKNSSNWGLKDFKKYLSYISNVIVMTAPALRKDTHMLYDLFSSDDIMGEIRVPDMISVLYLKLKHDPKLK